MAKDTNVKSKLPLWLKEILDNGNLVERFRLLDEHTSFALINKLSEQITYYSSLSKLAKLKPNKKKIAFFRDGPFLSNDITTGAIVSLLGEMDALADEGYEVYVFYCFRGWSDPELYKNQKFTTVFIKPEDFYTNSQLLRSIISNFGISICQFDSAEAVYLQADLVRPEAKVVFEVHNVEYDLLSQLKGKPSEISYIKNKERIAMSVSDLILVRSEQDSLLLQKLKKTKFNIHIFRGCINTDRIRFLERSRMYKKIVFLGHLNYAPNIQAVDLICKKIAPKVDAHFIIIGAGSEGLKKKYKNSNVSFLGYVNNLNSIFSQIDIGIAPIITGSGTRLKILDYMASGIPVIGTSRSIEGLEKEIHEAMIVEDKVERYPELINELLKNQAKMKLYSNKGHEYVSKYRNWKNCIGDVITAHRTLFS